MKLPEPAPDWLKIIKKANPEQIIEITTSKEFSGLISKANKVYEYWDKLRYLKIPENISSEMAWACIRFMRKQRSNEISMKDKSGGHFSFWLTDEILKQLHYIDTRAGGQVLSDEYSINDKDKERYLISSLMEEAIASSQLEGAATTREKAKKMLRSGKKPETVSDKMILNNYKTILHLRELKDRDLDILLIKEIHHILTNDTLENPEKSGEFRTNSDSVQVVDARDGQALFDPPNAEEIQERLNGLCDYVNYVNEEEFVHPVIKAIIIHFWLAYVHPFVDGNGRTARALFYWYLLKKGYWLFEFLSISRIIKNAPAQYARAYLYSEIDERDLNYFISYNLRAIRLSIEALWLYLRRRQNKLKESMKLIYNFPGLNSRQSDILRNVLANPGSHYTFKMVKNMFNVVYETARRDLFELVKKGFMEKRKVKREFYFIPVVDIERKLKTRKK
ncbi:MAG: Fic family protein [Endomicrobiales bacterium]|nr:Fic family protein [Endomicrobiales bacterium]